MVARGLVGGYLFIVFNRANSLANHVTTETQQPMKAVLQHLSTNHTLDFRSHVRYRTV